MTEPHRHHCSENLIAYAMVFLLLASIAASACDSESPTAAPPALREAPLGQAPDENEPEVDDALQSEDDSTATATVDSGSSTPPQIPQTEAEFEAEVARLMGESEAFRNAVGSIQVFDQVPEHFVRAEPVASAGRMTCNQPPSNAELNRVPVVEVHGDPNRQVSLFSRLANLKPSDLAPSQDPADPERP